MLQLGCLPKEAESSRRSSSLSSSLSASIGLPPEGGRELGQQVEPSVGCNASRASFFEDDGRTLRPDFAACGSRQMPSDTHVLGRLAIAREPQRMPDSEITVIQKLRAHLRDKSLIA